MFTCVCTVWYLVLMSSSSTIWLFVYPRVTHMNPAEHICDVVEQEYKEEPQKVLETKNDMTVNTGPTWY